MARISALACACLLLATITFTLGGCGSNGTTANNNPTPNPSPMPTPGPQPSPTPTPSPTPNPPAAAAFVYVANNGSAQNVGGSVSAFRIVAATGNLTPVAGSPFKVGNGPTAIGSETQGHFVFVAEDGSVTGAAGSNCNSSPSILLSEVVAAGSGALTQADSKTLNGVCARAVAVDPSGKDVYVAMGHAVDSLGEIQGFAIGANGTLTELPGSPFQVNGFPTGLAISPNGNFVYVASNNSGVLALSRDAATGALVETGTFNTPKNRLALNPAGTFMAATETNSNEVSQFNVDPTTGGIEAIDFRPSALAPYGVAADPLGMFFAVTETTDANTLAGGVSTFLLNNATHELEKTDGSPFAAGRGTVDVAFDPSGAFVYAVNRQDGTLSGFTLNRTSGALTPIAGSPFTTGDFSDSLVVVKAH